MLVAITLLACGWVGSAEVYVAERGPLTCYQARGIVRQAEVRLQQAGEPRLSVRWRIVFRPEPGFQAPVGYLRAFTICDSHMIGVTMHRPSSVLHEMMHALDCDAGIWHASKRHDGWRAKGRKEVEEDFTGESVTWTEGTP